MESGHWLQGATLYQIYPLSFRDGNGDGWGDLQGIIDGLPHIASLGVTAIWLSPVYTSPLADFGYDVADHCAIDPRFGDLETFDRLLAEAHRLELKVLMDLVIGHTSTRHRWFEDSRRSRSGVQADWYVWADPRPDGTPPTNWLSVFGGSAWSWEPRRRQYYLHHFLPEQPSLNLRHPGALAAVLDVARFWLERGVDGFRVDAVDHLMHDPALRDNPPATAHPASIPAKLFGMQRHVHDMVFDAVRPVLEQLRQVVDEYPGTVLLGELSSQPGATGRIAHYTAPGGLHSAYTLDLPKRPFTPAAFHAALMAVGGNSCWSFSNHDVERAASRWCPPGCDPAAASALQALLLACLPGTVCLYQGEELGLGQADLAEEDLRDPFGKAYWPEFKGRDGCRTPLPWTPTAPHGDFCPPEAKPWLPVPAAHLAQAVAVQDRRPGSTLAIWRAALALRRSRAPLHSGALTQVDEDGPVLAFVRVLGQERLTCIFNFSGESVTYPLPDPDVTALLLPRPPGAPEPILFKGNVTLPPLGAFLGRSLR
ncbi:alpha-glucosidase family protein [Oleisolibacter albus]|uniref:alpha-glucosidase family protein n=1 Tax=Oleisolibacter albus TaxID=2171757 RepID=UPI000DF20B67|nr:alpha-glucosidase family protein [Oleisolibacter albus]